MVMTGVNNSRGPSMLLAAGPALCEKTQCMRIEVVWFQWGGRFNGVMSVRDVCHGKYFVKPGLFFPTTSACELGTFRKRACMDERRGPT